MRYLLLFIMAALCIVTGAFVWFVQGMPSSRPYNHAKTDAIIVLTGGPGRVEQGLIALADDDAPILFISGVGEHVTRNQILLAHSNRDTRNRIAQSDGEIILDHIASTTRSNADQTTEFVRERRIRSIRLVTTYYHMPRSLLEFRMQMPGVDIIPDAVFPKGYRRHSWWQDKNTRKMVFSEFGKYYAALFLRNRPQ